MNPGLLRPVLLYPADDARRLILADWLEEQGDRERADFIRLQLAIAELEANAAKKFMVLPEDALGRQIAYLRGLEREAWGHVGFIYGIHKDMSKALPGWAMLLDGDIGSGLTHDYPWATVRRGFVAEVALTLADFEKHAAALFAVHPIERVTLTDRRFVNIGRLGLFGWEDPAHPGTIADVPQDLLRLVAGLSADGRIQTVEKEPLSTACVRFGRLAAGLDRKCKWCTRPTPGAKLVCPECLGVGYVVNEEGVACTS